MPIPRLESGTRTGWLFNYHATTETSEEDAEGIEGQPVGRAALTLLFQDHAGDTFSVNLHYNPYILVLAVEGHEREVELGMMSMFGPQLITQIVPIEKEDLDLINHLSGRKRLYLKVVFNNVQDLTNVRGRLEKVVKRNSSMTGDNPFWGQFSGSLGDAMAKSFEEDPLHNQMGSERWMDWVHDIREYDVKYYMRVAIDLKVFCGLWYDISITDGEATVVRCDDSKYAPAMPRVVAFDIETTKAPLRFPQPEVDQIYMISYMLDGRGYLIVNREIVTEDIFAFEYTPKPEYEGFFDTFNEPDEAATLRRFFDEMNKYQPNVYVTYNGDYFDFPFIHARALFHGMNMRREIGFSQMADGAFLNQSIPHLDCFYWVKRDSYLPQGSQGLKAVTKYKLGYDPIEVDPEDMLPLAQNHPQRMASYSVSDAVSTWYLYQKYVHPFIFSLATIIPMSPDDVLRKGSGGLCESLLMVQAEANSVVFPNKKELVRERFHDGHLIDTETYIGGRVEALRSGVYRSDIPMAFNMNPDTYQNLIDDVDSAMRFTLEVENGVTVEEVTNFEEVKEAITAKLVLLRDRPRQEEKPVIYHLDVGAMYPNIILTNRLQPYAIPSHDVCAGCCFNSPTNENHCKRVMPWKWRAELFTAGRYEFQRVKAQLENESFAASVVEQANLAAVQKKAYGNRKGNVLEGTAYERKDEWKKRKDGAGGGGGGSGYRQETKQQQREASDALLRKEFGTNRGSDDDDDDDDDDGSPKAYHKLNESTQFNMLKRRLAEYSRKAYGKIRESREIMRSNVVCQRENSFYVDTVRLFRDRRYEYKAALKTWKKRLDAAKDTDEVKLCKSRCVQMESLQLAHKCILNSFYGYVMRKGSRWSSMEMAGIVTYLGAGLIQMARALVQHIGITLELDTDGIWCCLPSTFPENFTFTTNNPKKPKIGISYPCVVLNKMVADRYSNEQYQNLVSPGVYKMHKECSIYFEVDGPYLAMLLPASREEGKSIKKRYAVFNPDGKLAELKGFELKRRGELMLIKDFQSQVFRRFLDGTTLLESYASAAVVANAALDMLESKGAGFDTEEILEKITESSNMSRKLSEYPEAQKSLAITTARRIAEFLGPQMVKDKGLACHFIISRLPAGRPVTERAIPTVIFRAEPAVRVHFMRKWTGDTSITADCDLKTVLDWDYYTARFNACVQKIITIPAALQSVPNPVPRVAHPEWLHKRVQQQNSRFRQVTLAGMLNNSKKRQEGEEEGEEEGADVVEVTSGLLPRVELQDIESLADPFQNQKQHHEAHRKVGSLKDKLHKDKETELIDPEEVDGDEDDGISVQSDDDVARAQREAEAEQEERVHALTQAYFTPKSTRTIDNAFFCDAAARPWLSAQRQAWLHRARLRKELATSMNAAGKGGHDARAARGAGKLTDGLSAGMETLDAHFIDVKSRALSTTWNILETRLSALEDPGVVTVLAALDGALHTFRVRVPRRILVDVDPGTKLDVVAANTVEVAGRILPRHIHSGRLYQVEVPPGSEGELLLNNLSITEGVRELYETHITLEERCVEALGCRATVNTQLYLKNSRLRLGQASDLFELDELVSCGSGGGANYLTKSSDRSAFIFHAVADTRGVVALINVQTSAATVVFIQPAGAQRPTNINWTTLSEEAAKMLHAAPVKLDVKITIVTDQAAAWRVVQAALLDASEGGPSGLRGPLLAVLQSATPTEELLKQRFIPATLPYLCVLGAVEDEKLFADPFFWARLLARRLLQRYYASVLWVEERLALSRIAGIPVCNLAQDSCAHALDVLYSRSLHRHSHVLWRSSDPAIAFDAVDERPRDVVMPGGYTSWCVEFSLSRLDVVAVLFSQVIQEGDDPSSHILCDRGVSTHFNILRDLIADLLGQAVHSSVADLLLTNVARWLRDPVSASYEPRIVEMLSGLAHRALTSILIRLAKLGGRTVKVDASSVVVLTSKHSLPEAVSFGRFVTSSVQDQPMLILLALQPARYWSPLVVLDRRDYAGLYIAADDAVRVMPDNDVAKEGNLASLMQLEHAFTVHGRLPQKLRELFVRRVRKTLLALSEEAAEVHRQMQTDPTVTLATRGEQVQQRLMGRSQVLFEDRIQTELMDEVQLVLDTRDLYTAEERDATPVVDGTPQLASSWSLALEYSKCICRVLDLFPSRGAIGKIRNNCMRLCNISPFSQQALFEPDPLNLVRTQCVTCSFCNAAVYVDLCAKPKASGFTCPECQAPFSAAAMEARLVRHVNQLVMNYNQQDFVCSKCKEMASTYLSESCCGPLVGKEKPLQTELRALLYVANMQDFTWLHECVEAALLTS